MSKRDEILCALEDIELLSSPAVGAMDVMNNPNASPDDIGRALTVDPALTVNLLRFANSAYFGCNYKVLTVKDAVVRLGVNVVSRMLLLTSSMQFSNRPVAGYGLEAGSLWDSMISTAVATDLLAKSLKIRPPAYAFTAGLLQNIGKLVLGSSLEVDAGPISELVIEKGIPFDEAERMVLGIDHAEVGAILLEKWSIPEEIVNAVRWSLDPDQCPGDKMVVDLVHAAGTLSMMAGAGLGVDGMGYAACQSTEERLGITDDVIEFVLGNLQDEVQKLMQMQ
jgi:HD-like signal output (HDOD) protein